MTRQKVPGVTREEYNEANSYLNSVSDICAKPGDISQADAQMAKVGVNAFGLANSVTTYKDDIEDVSFGGSYAGPFFEALGAVAEYLNEYAEDSQTVSDTLGMVSNAYEAQNDVTTYETETSSGVSAGSDYIM